MRVPCYFATPVPDSRFSLWLFGTVTDRHPACPAGIAVVVGADNEVRGVVFGMVAQHTPNQIRSQ